MLIRNEITKKKHGRIRNSITAYCYRIPPGLCGNHLGGTDGGLP